MAALTLVFGGTTEGKRSAALLDRLAIPFLYSTKERIEPFSTRHGQFRDGPLGQADIESLLQEREIGLVIDAAHPFAAELHQTVYEACEAIGIELIRYDRDADPLVDEMLSSSGVYRAADLEEALAILGRLSLPASLPSPVSSRSVRSAPGGNAIELFSASCPEYRQSRLPVRRESGKNTSSMKCPTQVWKHVVT